MDTEFDEKLQALAATLNPGETLRVTGPDGSLIAELNGTDKTLKSYTAAEIESKWRKLRHRDTTAVEDVVDTVLWDREREQAIREQRLSEEARDGIAMAMGRLREEKETWGGMTNAEIHHAWNGGVNTRVDIRRLAEEAYRRGQAAAAAPSVEMPDGFWVDGDDLKTNVGRFAFWDSKGRLYLRKEPGEGFLAVEQRDAAAIYAWLHARAQRGEL